MTQGEPRPLRQVEPTVPRDLETIVQTAIASDPKDRYATAAEFRDELERFLAELHFARDGSRLSAHAEPGKAGILEVSYQTECRSLIRDPGQLSQNTTALAIDHSGHHLAAACANGIIVRDMPTGTPVARLPVSGVVKQVLFDPAGSILTGSPMTLRWPVSSRTVDPTIGPPELLQWYQTRDGLSSSRDVRVVAIAIYNGGALVFDADRPANSRRILPQYDTRTAVLSPDGRRLATQGHTDRTLKYRDTRTGRTVHDFPVIPPRARPCSAPTGDFWPPSSPMAGSFSTSKLGHP